MKKSVRTVEKRGIVMHACPLVRSGLLCFLMAQLPNFTFHALASFSEMTCLPGLAQVDLVVSDLSDEEHNTAYGADWLMWLHQIRGGRPLVITTEAPSNSQLLLLSRQPFVSVLALQTPYTILVQQFQQALTGIQVIDPKVLPLSSPSPKLEQLTKAELQVLAWLHTGYSVTKIAEHLCRSVKTVSAHKRHLMQKLRVNNEIALFARVRTINEKVCSLDNGQQFNRLSHPYMH